MARLPPNARSGVLDARRSGAGSRMIPGLLAGAGFLIALAAAQPARADYAVLRSGQRLHITGWQNLGDTVRLDLPGGRVTIAAVDLVIIGCEASFVECVELVSDVP